MNQEAKARLDPSHPRYDSLRKREKIVEGYRAGLIVPQGLIAHGRGEMFDYLLGETTLPPALRAERAAAAVMLLAKKPVISVNGNLAALCPEAVVRLADTARARIEVNLFHRSDERAKLIREWLESCGAKDVLAENPDAFLDRVDHERGRCHSEGILSSDVVLIPLEDGDRASALVKMGKSVISIDLNPLSRTSLCATISIVDEVTRAVPSIARFVEELRNDRATASGTIESYDNDQTLRSIYELIIERLGNLTTD